MHCVVRMQSLKRVAEDLQPKHTHSVHVTTFTVYLFISKIEYGQDIVAAAQTFKKLVHQSLARENDNTGKVDNDELRRCYQLDQWGVPVSDQATFEDALMRCSLWEALAVTSPATTVTACFASFSLIPFTALFALRSLPFPVAGALQQALQRWGDQGPISCQTSYVYNGRQPSQRHGQCAYVCRW